ncbi:MAG: hypothetical protein QOC68_275 [Solirubrobacteraceae bacterium]|nr:hypothetical protein [Solirubrobacteraceae bacterium]
MVDEADELYGLPDDEFTSARDALAKRLRGEKRRDEADAVKALRRPSVAAAAINRAVREHGADDLLAAGEALRDAHEALLSGSGDAAAVRDATAREREAVRDFAARALGAGASASTEEKVRSTLHAASVDDDVRDSLVAGRLERDAEAGADPMALLAGGGKAGGRSRSSGVKRQPVKKGGSGGAKSGGGSRGRSRPSEAERRRAKTAERAQEAASRAVTAQAEAEEAAERARSTLAEAEEAARKARAVVEDLEGHERAARRAVKEAEAEAERRRTEARRAVKTADSRT